MIYLFIHYLALRSCAKSYSLSPQNSLINEQYSVRLYASGLCVAAAVARRLRLAQGWQRGPAAAAVCRRGSVAQRWRQCSSVLAAACRRQPPFWQLQVVATKRLPSGGQKGLIIYSDDTLLHPTFSSFFFHSFINNKHDVYLLEAASSLMSIFWCLAGVV